MALENVGSFQYLILEKTNLAKKKKKKEIFGLFRLLQKNVGYNCLR